MTAGGDRIERAIRERAATGEVALVAFLTAGYPDRERFGELLRAVGAVADVVEVGVPFSDPMADGVTIQRSSRAALEAGVSLRWILERLRGLDPRPAAPIVLMSYLNPLLALGEDTLGREARRAGVAGAIVPDLPLEECESVRAALGAHDVALIQLVTPVTPHERARALCSASEGFVYVVTSTGTTGGGRALPETLQRDLARLRADSPRPLCAGFGIRTHGDVRGLRGHADGVIVGSALIEELERGGDPVTFLRELRGNGERS